MNQAAAYFISIFTADLLILMFSVALVRGQICPVRKPAGLPIPAFQPYDLIGVILIMLFFSQAALLQFQASAPPTDGSTYNLGRYISLIITNFIVLIKVEGRVLRLKIGIPGRDERPSPGLIILLVIGSLAAMQAFSYLYQLSGIADLIARMTNEGQDQRSVQMFKQGSPAIKTVIAFSAIITAPLMEEFCFRGYLYPFFKKHAGAVFSALTTSLLFAVIHVDLLHAAPLFFLSLLLILCLEKSRSMITPIILHMTFNTITIIKISVSG